MPEEKRISPAVAIIPVGLGLAAIVAIAALALAAPPPIPPEDIVLSDLIVSPSEVDVGEPASISIVATNIGGTAGSYEINCEVL